MISLALLPTYIDTEPNCSGIDVADYHWIIETNVKQNVERAERVSDEERNANQGLSIQIMDKGQLPGHCRGS